MLAGPMLARFVLGGDGKACRFQVAGRSDAAVIEAQRQAQKRFKGELTEEDKQMISTQESALVLSAWLDAVVESATCADFRAALRS